MKTTTIFFFFLSISFFLLLSRPAFSDNQTCNSNDFLALQVFLGNLTSALHGWTLTSNSSACCSLPGVTCDSPSLSDRQRRVVGLVLTNVSLSGNLSASLGSLLHLQNLNLSSNSLSGPVPEQIFLLPELQSLDLSLNSLSGPIPFRHISLPSLRNLNLSYNSFHGAIDISRVCTDSVQLLSFSANMFSGEFPLGFGKCRSLRHLSLDKNSLSGSLPEDLFDLSSSLSELYLNDNNLSGNFTMRVANLSSLVHLDLSNNRFSGAIPDSFSGLRKLESLSAESNGFRGPLPASLSALANLRVLDLRNNSLGGDIGVLDFSGMVRLNTLDLGLNSLTGSLPNSLSRCPELTTVNLGTNDLAGEIPDGFKNMTALSYLSLSKNRFSNISSALAVLQHCSNLTYLVLTRNFYRGETMPSDGIAGFEKMKVLAIANCVLSGSIPRWLTRSTELMVLDLSWNRLDGTVPPWLGNFGSLFYLDISNNSLTGEIPESLTQMKSMISFNSSNQGPLIPNFSFYTIRNVSAQYLQYNKVSSFPPSLILSDNGLTGPILPGFGNLRSLLEFDLHKNNLSGPIPEQLSQMLNLESLDLSYNNLTGVIPPSLAKLNFLASFDVAHNNLVGPIPRGTQFSTFPPSSFIGNPGLCNASFCTSDAPPTPIQSSSRKNKGAAIGMAMGIGIGMALLLTVIYLVLSRSQFRRQDDKAKVVADADELLDLGTSLVLLFQNKDQSGLTIADIMKSTNNFDQACIIGCGGFGLVYKATLEDGKKVAIKRLSGDFCQMEREFQAEVETLSRAEHENLVPLQGYCRVGNDRLLIYSYMENTSLDYWLHERLESESGLNWSRRLRIAQGAARGLAYLHDSCQPHILHRDIKSSNILLDENFKSHLADFGLARLILPQNTHVTTDLVGTLGYIPPEYGHCSIATYRGDVYSFGVVLLELLTGRRPVDMCKPKGCRDLIAWVFEMKEKERVVEVFDVCIYDDENDGQMKKMLEIACHCVNGNPKLRPLTQQIVTWLNEIDSEC